MFCGAALRGSDLAAALRPRGPNKCAALWAAAAAAGAAGADAARMMSSAAGAEAARMLCSITAILVRNCVLGTAHFAELAAGAGVRAYGVPSHAGGLPANTGERRGHGRGGEKWTNAGIWPIRGWAVG